MQCSVNVLIEWESGKMSWQPLHCKDKAGIYDCDPVTVAIYARKNTLLDAKGWKLPGLEKLVKTQKRVLRHAKQAKLHSFRTKAICMYGFEVPCNHEQVVAIDQRNGSTKLVNLLPVYNRGLWLVLLLYPPPSIDRHPLDARA